MNMNTETLPPSTHNFDRSVFRKLTKLTRLKGGELSALSRLHSTPLHVAKGETLIEMPATQQRFFVVTSGWLCAHSGQAGLTRQVYDIFQAGDFVGFETLLGAGNYFSVEALTSAQLIEISPSVMAQFMMENPHIAQPFHALNALRHIVLMDRMRSIARQKPRARVAHFLLEIANRERVTSLYHDGENGNSLTFNLPMVQIMLADCIGLTAVHISRTLTWMTQENLIERPARALITLKNETALIDLAQYRNRYIPFKPPS